MQGTRRSAPSWILHMRKCAAHPISALDIAQRVINGAVHCKYTEENQLTHSASQTVTKIVSVKVLVLGYCNGTSRKYETDTPIFCGYRL